MKIDYSKVITCEELINLDWKVSFFCKTVSKDQRKVLLESVKEKN